MNNVKHTVLVIEDEQYISKVLETLLSADGYRVITAQSGAAARAHVFSYMPDVVLLDLGLPDVDGIQLLRELRERIDIPVIVVSARNMEKDKVAALDNGADDYITKPFGTGELLARVRVALRDKRQLTASAPSARFQLKELQIDYDKRLVQLAGETVALTQTEYNILAMLAEHAGKVLTYSAIIKTVWGYQDPGSIKRLQVNMANIRKKLGIKPGDSRYILNELGVGYRMREENE